MVMPYLHVYLWACSGKCSLVRQPLRSLTMHEPHPRDHDPTREFDSRVITVVLNHVFDELKKLQVAEEISRSTFGDANSLGAWTTQAWTIPQGQVCLRDEKTARVFHRCFSWNGNEQTRSHLGHNKLQRGLWAQDTCSSGTSASCISYKDEQSSPLPGEVGSEEGGGLQLMSPSPHKFYTTVQHCGCPIWHYKLILVQLQSPTCIIAESTMIQYFATIKLACSLMSEYSVCDRAFHNVCTRK